jgi:hypothetical protein
MESRTRRMTEWRGPTRLDSNRQTRLVALLAAGLERLLTAQGRTPKCLAIPADLCVYTDDAEPDSDADV